MRRCSDLMRAIRPSLRRIHALALSALVGLSGAPWGEVWAQGGRALNAQVEGGSAAAGTSPSTKPWTAIGRPATRSEIRAWDIDVRPDFKGLPAGAGSVESGQDVWEAKCASCHGVFGESNEVFTPVVGGTTAADIQSGRVANLRRSDFPQRTTLMKLSQLSTLWDYINRAMPWNEPKSLKTDEVYSVVAYILHLGDIVPAGFVLSQGNIAAVQQRLPNRGGMVRFEGMAAVSGKPDVQGEACMRDCATEPALRSILPDFARNAHGNLAEQSRPLGPVRGVDTTIPALREPLSPQAVAALRGAFVSPQAARTPAVLARESNCLACHAPGTRLIGPAFSEIAERYRGDSAAADQLARRIREGAQGVWGPTPMPAHSTLADDDIRTLVRWILSGES